MESRAAFVNDLEGYRTSIVRVDKLQSLHFKSSVPLSKIYLIGARALTLGEYPKYLISTDSMGKISFSYWRVVEAGMVKCPVLMSAKPQLKQLLSLENHCSIAEFAQKTKAYSNC